MTPKSLDQLIAEFKAGSSVALSKLISLVENRDPGWIDVMKLIYPDTGNATIIGITGPPGAGKSTLTSAIAGEISQKGQSVGIIAVDPTSPFSGGAVLGDRIRMTATLEMKNVFARSLATRGLLGGLSQAVGDVVKLMDAFGKNVIIIETVGVGQDEVEVIHVTDLVVVVCVPGMGDSIQAIKAGVLEIADIFVVNKADRDGTDQLVMDLKNMIEMNTIFEKTPPQIFKTIAHRADGIGPVVEHLMDIGGSSDQSGELERSKIKNQVITLSKKMITDWLSHTWAKNGSLDNAVQQVIEKTNDPYTVAEHLTQIVKTAMGD